MNDEEEKVPPLPGRRKRPKKTRATKTEQEYRRRQLMTMLKNGYGTADLRQYAMEQFGLKTDAAFHLVDEVLEAVVAAMGQHDMRRLAATTFMRFEHAFRVAAQMKNPSAMVAANDAIARYWIKTPPEVVVTGDGGEDEDHLGDF